MARDKRKIIREGYLPPARIRVKGPAETIPREIEIETDEMFMWVETTMEVIRKLNPNFLMKKIKSQLAK